MFDIFNMLRDALYKLLFKSVDQDQSGWHDNIVLKYLAIVIYSLHHHTTRQTTLEMQDRVIFAAVKSANKDMNLHS